MTTASLETRNRSAVPGAPAQVLPTPTPGASFVLMLIAARRAPSTRSQVRAVALPSRQGEGGEGVDGKEAEIQGSRVAPGKGLATRESIAEVGLKATFVCPT